VVEAQVERTRDHGEEEGSGQHFAHPSIPPEAGPAVNPG
jgi:hypothetical protein